MKHFFGGKTLGGALNSNGFRKKASGQIFGDPLYQPSAARIFAPNFENGIHDIHSDFYTQTNPSLAYNIGPMNPENSVGNYYVLAFHGRGRLGQTLWELSKCFNQTTPLKCDAENAWQKVTQGKAAFEAQKLAIPGDLAQLVDDASKDQKLHLRLKVFVPGEDANALYDYASFQYLALP
jgi:hypothetical protein